MLTLLGWTLWYSTLVIRGADGAVVPIGPGPWHAYQTPAATEGECLAHMRTKYQTGRLVWLDYCCLPTGSPPTAADLPACRAQFDRVRSKE